MDTLIAAVLAVVEIKEAINDGSEENDTEQTTVCFEHYMFIQFNVYHYDS